MSKKKVEANSSFNPLSFLPYFAIGLLTTLALGISIANLNIFLDKQKVLGVSAQVISTTTPGNLESEKDFWIGIVNNNPTYRDGYIELADIQYKLGRKQLAQKMIENALEIDPNSPLLAQLVEKYK